MACYNATAIKASPPEVWNRSKDFHDVGWSTHVVTKEDLADDAHGSTIGAKRVLNDAFPEMLLSFDVDDMAFTYRIDAGPGAVLSDNMISYMIHVEVLPVIFKNSGIRAMDFRMRIDRPRWYRRNVQTHLPGLVGQYENSFRRLIKDKSS